jgi:hypothetical protein
MFAKISEEPSLSIFSALKMEAVRSSDTFGTRPHGVTSKNRAVLIFMDVRTSNLA